MRSQEFRQLDPEAIGRAFSPLVAAIRHVSQQFAELGRQIARAFSRLPRQPTAPPPHAFVVGSYDLECRYPSCTLTIDQH